MNDAIFSQIDFGPLKEFIDIDDITLETEEVSDIKWVDATELVRRIHNNYEDLTTKSGCWEYLEKYLELKG